MRTSTKQDWANGGIIFAAVVMLIIGLYQIFEGLAAIWQGSFFVITQPGYAYEINTAAFGWIHLAVGAVVLAAGLFLFTGHAWAKAIAIVLAIVSAMTNFFFLPYYPLWSLLIIALDVFVIWAIATARSPMARDAELRESELRASGMGPYGGNLQSGEPWPAENVAGGRHWASDVKESTKEQAAREAAAREAAAREAAGAAGAAMPPNPPPPPPPSARG